MMRIGPHSYDGSLGVIVGIAAAKALLFQSALAQALLLPEADPSASTVRLAALVWIDIPFTCLVTHYAWHHCGMNAMFCSSSHTPHRSNALRQHPSTPAGLPALPPNSGPGKSATHVI
jgi:hypothetical protein